MEMEKKRIAIIGGAASGLPSIRHALLYENYLEPVCFELTNDIGGLWRYKENDRNYKGLKVSSVMKSTVINTSKEMTAYSDFPPKPETANFMHNSEMLQYLRDYAEHFGLKKYIKFNHKVLSIERNEDYLETGKWKIIYLDEKDIEHVEIFDGVLLASGHHSEPRWPMPFPNQEKFKGKLLHSHDYFTHKGFEDQIVAVVGIGNSGGDLAVELSRIAKQVYLITRRGTWICNRLLVGGIPRDVSTTRKDLFLRKFTSFNKLNDAMEELWNSKLNHEAYGLKPKHRFMSAHPTCNDELANRLANKTIKIKPNIKEFTENGIIFDDNTEVSKVDSVIFATGYKFNFPLIEHGNLIPVDDDNSVSLYLNMFAPELSDHNTLGIIGLVQVLGSLLPVAEMQARLFYEVFVGNTKLPKKKEMLETINQKHEEMRKRYIQSPRHTIQVDFGIYMDELGSILGCKPNIFKLIFTDPILAWALWNNPPISCTYRLIGPNPWEGARKALMECKNRIYAGMSPNGTNLIDLNNNSKKKFSFIFSRIFTTTLILAIAFGILSKKISYEPLFHRFNNVLWR